MWCEQFSVPWVRCRTSGRAAQLWKLWLLASFNHAPCFLRDRKRGFEGKENVLFSSWTGENVRWTLPLDSRVDGACGQCFYSLEGFLLLMTRNWNTRRLSQGFVSDWISPNISGATDKHSMTMSWGLSQLGCGPPCSHSWLRSCGACPTFIILGY